MKMKRIMLITFLLLAVLTIGAVSAEDNNATSDDLQVADDGDDVIELSGYDEDEHYIEVTPNGDIYLDSDKDTVAEICLPSNIKKGSFRILNGNEEVARSDINLNDEHWKIDEDDDTILKGNLFLKDLNMTKINDGDTLSLMFYELKNNEYTPFDPLTLVCTVKLTELTMILNEMTGVEIDVKNIDINKTDENFTFVNVIQKEGTFIIKVATDYDDYFIFKENLKTTKRQYSEFDDEYGVHYYCFAFSLADINSYIAQNINGANSITDLIDKGSISSDDEMYFALLEDADDEDSEIDYESLTILIKDGKILFDDEGVDVDYSELDVVMDEGWNETVIITYEVKKEIKGKIIICLNDNSTPAFEKNLSELVPDEDSDDDFDYYSLTVADLNITQAGEYVLHCYFDDESGNRIYPYDEEDPETLVLYPTQTTTGDNATIRVNPAPISVDEDEWVIKINITGDANDTVTVYVDENDDPIILKLADCEMDGESYIIKSQQLKLGVGQHTLNITCKGTNSLENVTILTDLEIYIEDETVYTTLNGSFVFISLKDGDITESQNITGLINVTITDSKGNVIDIIQKDLEDYICPDYEMESFVIRTNDANVKLNGTYTVSVIYYNGNKGIVKTEGNVTFKELGADDYGVSINDTIYSDNIIIFNDIPLDNDILVEIDGNESLIFNTSSLKKIISQGKEVYSIKQDQLGLSDGSHSIKVYIDTGAGIINLANVSVTVDLVKNVDPALNISVSDIEVGNAAIVLITTNSTFTGKVAVQIANNTYSVDVEKGKGNVSVADLAVGTYTATAVFTSDAFFISSTKNATFNVAAKTTPAVKKDDVKPASKKQTIKLTLKKVKVKKSAKKLVLKATLKINGKVVKNKWIKFKFNKKTYKAKTNNKGIAKATIKKKILKKLKKGKKVKIQASYGKIVKKYTVKVRK